jgi:glycosyltransferase involved in cell wall biosynthesis
MRLLFVVGGYPPAKNEGGPGKMVEAVASHLNANGSLIDVVTTNRDGNTSLPLRGWNDVDYGRVYYGNLTTRAVPYFSIGMLITLVLKIRNYDYVSISSSWNLYGVIAGLVCEIFDVPYFVYSHGSYHPIRVKKNGRIKFLWWGLFDNRLYRKAKYIIAMSAEEVGHIREWGYNRNNVEILPIGVNEIYESPSNSDLNREENPYILYLGRVSPIKNLEGTIDYFAPFLSKGLLKLLIAGGGDAGYLETLKRYCKSKGLQGDIEFLGAVSEEKKYHLIKNCNYFALLSKGEGLPQAVLEAMHMGKKVIISKECNMEAAVKSGVAYLYEDPVTIEMIEMELSKNQGVTSNEKISAYAKEHFSWKSIVPKLKRLLESEGGL